MAEAAAPAAPSGGAPVAEAQPAPGPASEAVQSTPAPAESRVKPIKSPPLPGVFPDDDPFPAPPSAPDAERPSAAAPPRGPDGRFVAASATSPVEGEHPRPQSETPQPERFRIAGEEYESQAAFEQQFKSLRGQFKSVQALARSLGGMEQVVPHFQRAAESARGWKAEAERLKAELESRTSMPAQPQSPTPDEPAAEADIDWELYAEVKKLATEAGEPWKADQWLIAQVREAERNRLDGLLNEKLAPLTQAQQQAGVIAQAAELFGNLKDYEMPDGSPAFPELSDADAAENIGRYWASLGLPMEHMLTPQAASAAIALYRMAQSFGSQAGSAAQPPPTPPPVTAAPTDAQSAAGLTEGRPSVASIPGNGATLSPEAARIIAGLRKVNQGNRALLGFDA